MDEVVEKTTLVKAAEDFLATAKSFDGNPLARMALVKQADNLPLLFRRWLWYYLSTVGYGRQELVVDNSRVRALLSLYR